MWTLLLTAVGLAMDAVAVSVASGLSVNRLKLRDALSMAAVFGALQGLMPVAGFVLGQALAGWLDAYDHWIAFLLLVGLGVKMIRESRHAAEQRIHSPFRPGKMLMLGIATSVDAFAVGVSFSLMDVGLAAMAGTIALTTFVLCLPAVWFGSRLGKLFARRAEVFGGAVLIAIGCKILHAHLVAGI